MLNLFLIKYYNVRDGAMSHSNMNMLLDMMGTVENRNLISAFGNWTGVAFLIADTSDPDNIRFSVIPTYGTIPPLQLVPDP